MTAKVTARTGQRSSLDLERSDLTGFARSIAMVSILLIALSVAHFYFDPQVMTSRETYVALIVAFAVVTFAIRLLPVMRRRVRLRLTIESVAMTLFVTALAIITGGIDSPVVNLFMLPLIVGSIVLGRTASILLLLLVFFCHLGLTFWNISAEPLGPQSVVAALLRFAPVLLVTYLATLLAENIRSTRRQIITMSEKDDLTELYNMRAFTARLDAAHLASIRHQQEYRIVMLDVDNLKPINDDYGHEAGNRAIQLVGKAISRCIRSSDIAARYGGDEFIVLLPHSNQAASEKAILRIRNSIYATTLKVGPKMVRISVSIGLASYPKDGADPGELLAAADKAMYLDKAFRREQSRKEEAKGLGDPA